MSNALEDIKPEILNKHLPQPAPYGVAEWGFVLKTGQVCFVNVDDFNFQPGDHYLRVPVVLGVRTEGAQQVEAVLPEQAGVFTIEGVDGNTICYAHLKRDVGDVWHATLNLGAKDIGNAKGTIGTATPFAFIEAALIALVRHVAAKNK
jgi:hypothetical protein